MQQNVLQLLLAGSLVLLWLQRCRECCGAAASNPYNVGAPSSAIMLEPAQFIQSKHRILAPDAAASVCLMPASLQMCTFHKHPSAVAQLGGFQQRTGDQKAATAQALGICMLDICLYHWFSMARAGHMKLEAVLAQLQMITTQTRGIAVCCLHAQQSMDSWKARAKSRKQFRYITWSTWGNRLAGFVRLCSLKDCLTASAHSATAHIYVHTHCHGHIAHACFKLQGAPGLITWHTHLRSSLQ